jgi:hypothetical protein
MRVVVPGVAEERSAATVANLRLERRRAWEERRDNSNETFDVRGGVSDLRSCIGATVEDRNRAGDLLRALVNLMRTLA